MNTSDTLVACAATDYDLIICGAGPVGLSVASLLHRHSIGMAQPARIALIDARPEQGTGDAAASADPRTIALSHGSRQMLAGIGAWPALQLAVTAIHQIHVSRRQHFGRTLIRREDHQLPALGYVVRYGPLLAAISATLADSGVSLLRPAQVVAIHEQASQAQVELADGRRLRAAIVVQAEGGVFSEQAPKQLQRDYQQTAIIAHVRSSAPVAGRAFERFTAEGPLALLPQEDGYALVWCVRPASASRLLALDDARFLQELGQMFGQRLGRFTYCSARSSYPLGLNALSASAATSAHTVAIGNAAQTLHPVAGQGLNLGLRDATVLVQALLQNGYTPAALQQFSRLRQPDRHTTIRLTDCMARLFASTGTLTQSMLGLSLATIDLIAPAKRLLAEQMLFGRR